MVPPDKDYAERLACSLLSVHSDNGVCSVKIIGQQVGTTYPTLQQAANASLVIRDAIAGLIRGIRETDDKILTDMMSESESFQMGWEMACGATVEQILWWIKGYDTEAHTNIADALRRDFKNHPPLPSHNKRGEEIPRSKVQEEIDRYRKALKHIMEVCFMGNQVNRIAQKALEEPECTGPSCRYGINELLSMATREVCLGMR